MASDESMLRDNRGVILRSLLLLFMTLGSLPARGDDWPQDWPQWRGPMRDGVWRAFGVRSDLPKGDLPTGNLLKGKLPIRWRVPAALGYAGPAVAAGKVFLFEYEKRSGEIKNSPDVRIRLEGVERLRCLNAASGDELWRHEYNRPYQISYPSGPRCTPTVDGERVYTLGAEGRSQVFAYE